MPMSETYDIWLKLQGTDQLINEAKRAGTALQGITGPPAVGWGGAGPGAGPGGAPFGFLGGAQGNIFWGKLAQGFGSGSGMGTGMAAQEAISQHYQAVVTTASAAFQKNAITGTGKAPSTGPEETGLLGALGKAGPIGAVIAATVGAGVAMAHAGYEFIKQYWGSGIVQRLGTTIVGPGLSPGNFTTFYQTIRKMGVTPNFYDPFLSTLSNYTTLTGAGGANGPTSVVDTTMALAQNMGLDPAATATLLGLRSQANLATSLRGNETILTSFRRAFGPAAASQAVGAFSSNLQNWLASGISTKVGAAATTTSAEFNRQLAIFEALGPKGAGGMALPGAISTMNAAMGATMNESMLPNPMSIVAMQAFRQFGAKLPGVQLGPASNLADIMQQMAANPAAVLASEYQYVNANFAAGQGRRRLAMTQFLPGENMNQVANLMEVLKKNPTLEGYDAARVAKLLETQKPAAEAVGGFQLTLLKNIETDLTKLNDYVLRLVGAGKDLAAATAALTGVVQNSTSGAPIQPTSDWPVAPHGTVPTPGYRKWLQPH